MYHYTNNVQNASGDALAGYFVKLSDPVTGALIPIYSDDSSTPIITASGVANAAQADNAGNVSFYVPAGNYNLDVYRLDALTLVNRINSVAMMAGPIGPIGPIGPAGPASLGIAVTTRTIQPFLPTVTGSTIGGTGTFALNDPIKTDGNIDKIVVTSTAVSAIKIRVFRGTFTNGQVLTYVGQIALTTAVGVNTFTAPANFAALAVNKGDFIAFYSPVDGGVSIINNATSAVQFDMQGVASDTGTGNLALTNAYGAYGPMLSVGVTGTRVATPTAKLASSGGRFPAEYGLILAAGQSLNLINGDTVQSPLSTAQEHDNLGIPANIGLNRTLYPLVVNSVGYNSNNESPIFGAMNFMKDLILQENGVAYTDQKFQLVGEINAVTNTTIAQNSFGTTPFTNGTNTLQNVKDNADANGRSTALLAVLWEQGQADTVLTRAAYLTAIKQLADDYDTYGRAVTGATSWRPVLILTQPCEPIGTVTGISLAQLDAAIEHERIYCAGPDYWLTFGDTIHPTATYSRLLGAQFGLAMKRVIVDQVEWEPLRPMSYSVVGSTVMLKMSKGGLTLDTTLLPAQTNFGFTAVDSGGSAVTISSVALVGTDQVRITLAVPAASGMKMRYGFNAMTGRSDTSAYGGGNLRDNQGARITYKGTALHNWCVLFEQII